MFQTDRLFNEPEGNCLDPPCGLGSAVCLVSLPGIFDLFVSVIPGPGCLL